MPHLVLCLVFMVIMKSALCGKSDFKPFQSHLVEVNPNTNMKINKPGTKWHQIRICFCHFVPRKCELSRKRKSRKLYSKRENKQKEGHFEEGAENLKSDTAGLFDYLKARHGDGFLEKLKTSLKQRGFEMNSESSFDSKEGKPKYDRKIDEKDSLLKYKKWQFPNIPEYFQTDSFHRDSSNYESNSDINDETSGLKATDKLKPVTNTTKKAAAVNDTAVDNINRKIDNEILPALTEISKQLKELKEKEKLKTDNKNGEGGPCRPDGTWISSLGGIKVAITTLKNMSLNVKINSNGNKNSSLGVVDSKWIFEGFTLSKFGGPFALIGIYPEKRGLISFVGQCTVCHEEETIGGMWTISGVKADKNESQVGIESKTDVMKKEKSGQAQKGKASKVKEHLSLAEQYPSNPYSIPRDAKSKRHAFHRFRRKSSLFPTSKKTTV